MSLTSVRIRLTTSLACLMLVGGCTASSRSDRSWFTRPSEKPKSAAPESDVQLVAAEVASELDAPGVLDASVFEEAKARSASTRVQPRDANTQPSDFRPISEGEVLAQAFACAPVLRSFGLRILENPDGIATIYDRAITASDPFFGPDAALAEFDSAIGGGVNAQKNDRVFNNAIEGGGAQELTQDFINMNGTWQRRNRIGGLWSINDITLYDNNNRIGNLFPNYWEKQFEAGVRQPLLRGAGRRFNEIAGPSARPGFNFSNGIVIAQLNTQLTGADFELGVQDFVRELYSAYWDLVRQYQTYDSVLAARDLAYRTWQNVLARNKANLSGGEANKEAQARAKYYRYCREVQITLGGDSGRGGLYAAERRLRQMIGLPLVEKALLRPVESPANVQITFDYETMISRAMAQRVELKRQSLQVRKHRLQLVAAKNFLLPQLDFIGRYRMRGFGDDLSGGDGRFSSAYRDLYSFDHQEVKLGMEMGMVVGRRQARAAVRNASWKLSRAQAVLREQQRSVEHQVSDAVADVSSSYQAMQTSMAQAQAGRERLESSQALYDADKLQIEFLLDAQEELAQVEKQLAADQNRYALALVNVHNVTGQLLQESGIYISACDSCVQVMDSGSTTEHSAPDVSSLEVTATSVPLGPAP